MMLLGVVLGVVFGGLVLGLAWVLGWLAVPDGYARILILLLALALVGVVVFLIGRGYVRSDTSP